MTLHFKYYKEANALSDAFRARCCMQTENKNMKCGAKIEYLFI